MGRLFRELNEEKLEQIRNHPYFEKARENLASLRKKYVETDPPRIRFTDIHQYVVTGNRSDFQKIYFEYEDRLCVLFFEYLLYRDESLIGPLSDIIWNICDFESWSIPAHVDESLPEARRKINLDLCSTNMAYRIAEVLYFIGDQLPALVKKRAEYEVRTRLIESYLNNDDYWWMTTTSNWAAVCIGGTAAAFLYQAAPEEIEAALPRMRKTMEGYLSGFDAQGCCTEGYAYWGYGFSYFCLFATLLRDYTDGEIDYFKDPRVHRIALFQQNVSMNDTEAVSFADCGLRFAPSAWLSHLLKHEYDDVAIPSLDATVGTPLRYLVFSDPALAVSKMTPMSYTYHETQWFLYRSEAYNLAIKAGFNNELHNHNDVGSFILSKNGKVTFCDPGGGEYTKQYFSSERYTILACSSRGHSVPIVNGENQVTGEEKANILVDAEKEYSFDMKNGYAVPSLESLVRDAKCEDDRFVLTDDYAFSEDPTSVVERFVTYWKPEDLGGGKVKVGDTVLHFDEKAFSLSFGDELFVRGSSRDPLYFVDLGVKDPKKKMRFVFVFD